MEPALQPNPTFSSQRWGGYDHGEVHAYIRQVLDAYEAATAENERLRAAAPLAQIEGDISRLVTTFAETVAACRDEAAAEIERSRQETKAYVEEKRAEADRLVADARNRAQLVVLELFTKAHQEVSAIARQWAITSDALEAAAGGVASALAALSRLAELPETQIASVDDSGTSAANNTGPRERAERRFGARWADSLNLVRLP